MHIHPPESKCPAHNEPGTCWRAKFLPRPPRIPFYGWLTVPSALSVKVKEMLSVPLNTTGLATLFT